MKLALSLLNIDISFDSKDLIVTIIVKIRQNHPYSLLNASDYLSLFDRKSNYIRHITINQCK